MIFAPALRWALASWARLVRTLDGPIWGQRGAHRQAPSVSASPSLSLCLSLSSVSSLTVSLNSLHSRSVWRICYGAGQSQSPNSLSTHYCTVSRIHTIIHARFPKPNDMSIEKYDQTFLATIRLYVAPYTVAKTWASPNLATLAAGQGVRESVAILRYSKR